MEINPRLTGEDAKPNSPLKFIEANALGVPIVLSGAPTTAGGQLKANQWGLYGADIYFNIGGTVYKFAGTAV